MAGTTFFRTGKKFDYLRTAMAVIFLLCILPLTLSKPSHAHENNLIQFEALIPDVRAGTSLTVLFRYRNTHNHHDTTGWQIKLDGTTILASGTNPFTIKVGPCNPPNHVL